MSDPRRLISLPGYDTAPDIYETPDLADDTTTSTSLTQQTSPRSSSESPETTDEEDDEEYVGVSRRRLYPERARSRFAAGARNVDSRGVDLSDRVDGRRRGYRVRKRGTVGAGEDEDEGLEQRIARLRREIEQCRVEAEQAREGDDEETREVDEVDGLSRLLAGIDGPKGGSGSRSREGPRLGRRNTPGEWPDGEAGGGGMTDEQTLGRVADFDSRLAALEQALGISALDSATLDAVSAPILPSLTLLDQQLGALNSATSLANLEAASTRIQNLRNEAAALSHTQTTTTDSSQPESTDPDTDTTLLTQSDLTNLHSLYALLPTLQSLSPTVPALLTRLRSLRTLHTSAATAAADLEDVEKRQQEMEQELAAWREGLERVESAVLEASEANGRNGKVVEGWVRDLEGRMKTLGR